MPAKAKRYICTEGIYAGIYLSDYSIKKFRWRIGHPLKIEMASGGRFSLKPSEVRE